jgi:hypothetical protein
MVPLNYNLLIANTLELFIKIDLEIVLQNGIVYFSKWNNFNGSGYTCYSFHSS